MYCLCSKASASWWMVFTSRKGIINPLYAEITFGSIWIYLNFLSVHDIEMVQVLEYLPCGRQGPVFLPHSPVIYNLWPWFSTIWEWFPKFCKVITEKNIVEEIESIMGTLVEWSSPTEITDYRSLFLDYKLTQMNSIPHRRQWRILYILHCQYSRTSL